MIKGDGFWKEVAMVIIFFRNNDANIIKLQQYTSRKILRCQTISVCKKLLAKNEPAMAAILFSFAKKP